MVAALSRDGRRECVRLVVISESLAGPLAWTVAGLAARLRFDGDSEALRGRGRASVLA